MPSHIHQQPERFPRRILLAATGLAPQILTETLYALAVLAKPAFIPHEVHLVTTVEGAEYARHTLLDAGMGRLAALLKDYGLEGQVAFNIDHIHIIDDGRGAGLEDIQSPEDNLHAANFITDLVRQFTQSPDTALHVSIAGGRKTMGFFMGYALSLYGRPQDRLSHVLVSPPFESNHEFYYPPSEPRILFDRNNKPINTEEARITLADIPFVRLRVILAKPLIEGRSTFGEVVEAAQGNFTPPSIQIHLQEKRLICGTTPIPMQPIVLAFYAWMAWRKLHGLGPVRHTDADPQEFLAIYKQIAGEDSADYERTALELAGGMEKEFFEQKKSLANGALRRALGLSSTPYLICAEGKRPLTRYVVELDTDKIELLDFNNRSGDA